jgi:hypothetical protein
MIYKTLHRKLKIGQYKRRVSSLYDVADLWLETVP